MCVPHGDENIISEKNWLGFKITMDGLSSQVTKIISIAEFIPHINSTLLTKKFPEEGIYEFIGCSPLLFFEKKNKIRFDIKLLKIILKINYHNKLNEIFS